MEDWRPRYFAGEYFPDELDLTIRGIYHRDPPQNALYFNAKYLEEAVPWFKGQAGWYAAQIDSAETCCRRPREQSMICSATRRCRPRPRARRAFQLGFVASLGN